MPTQQHKGRRHIVYTDNVLAPVAGQNISRFQLLGCVLTANKLLQGLNRTEPRPPLLGNLSFFVPHQVAIVAFTYVQTNRAKEETPFVSEQRLQLVQT